MATDPYADLTGDTEQVPKRLKRLNDDQFSMDQTPTDARLVAPVTGTMGGGYGDSRSGGSRKHLAGDMFAPAGDPVIAPGNMKFIQGRQGGTNLRDNDWWSHWEDIDTGIEYRFAHHGPISHNPGDIVEKGQQWNIVGNAIKSPHLHMAVRDPMAGQNIDWISPMGLKRGAKLEAGLGFNDIEKRVSSVAATVGHKDPYADLAGGIEATKDPYTDLATLPAPPSSLVDRGIDLAKNVFSSGNAKVDTVPNPFQAQGPSLIDQVGTAAKNLIQQPGSAEEAAVAGFTEPPPVEFSTVSPELSRRQAIRPDALGRYIANQPLAEETTPDITAETIRQHQGADDFAGAVPVLTLPLYPLSKAREFATKKLTKAGGPFTHQGEVPLENEKFDDLMLKIALGQNVSKGEIPLEAAYPEILAGGEWTDQKVVGTPLAESIPATAEQLLIPAYFRMINRAIKGSVDIYQLARTPTERKFFNSLRDDLAKTWQETRGAKDPSTGEFIDPTDDTLRAFWEGMPQEAQTEFVLNSSTYQRFGKKNRASSKGVGSQPTPEPQRNAPALTQEPSAQRVESVQPASAFTPEPIQGGAPTPTAPANTFQDFIAQTGGHQADPAVMAHDLLEMSAPGWAFSPEGVKELTPAGPEAARLQKDLALVFAARHPELAGQVPPDEIYQHLTAEDLEEMSKTPRGKKLLERVHTAATARMTEAQGELQAQAAEVQQQEAEEAAARAQAPVVDKTRPAKGTLFTPEQIDTMTQAEYEALPPEQQKRFDRDVKAYQAEKEKSAATKAAATKVEKKPALRKVEKPAPEKLPYQMTQAEYVDGTIKSPGMHRESVRLALAKGKEVPAAVLKDYPDLAGIYGKGAKDTVQQAGEEGSPVTTGELNKRITLKALIEEEANRGGSGWTYAWPKPEGDIVTIYRGLRGQAPKEIRKGDWVTLDKETALRVAGGDEGKVISKEVRTEELAAMNPIINEFAYNPTPPPAEAKGKEAWEMTRQEFDEYWIQKGKEQIDYNIKEIEIKIQAQEDYIKANPDDPANISRAKLIDELKVKIRDEKDSEHRLKKPSEFMTDTDYLIHQGIKEALNRGEKVPASVLADYPGLKPAAKQAKPGLTAARALREKFGTARKVGKPTGLTSKDSPLSRASDRGDLRGVIKGLGGIKSTSSILKNFEPGERKKLIGLIRTDGMGADVLADTINKEYSHLGYYETDADLIRALVDGSYKKLLNENILAEEEAYYARQIDAEVERTGVSEVDLTEAERIAEAEVAREEIAGRSVTLEEADLSWDVKPTVSRLEALQEAYPELDPKNLELVLKTFPDGPTDQIIRMAKDPKVFEQLRRQRLQKLSDAGGDADQMQALPGMGGLFEAKYSAKFGKPAPRVYIFHSIKDYNLDEIIKTGGVSVAPSIGISKDAKQAQEFGDIIFLGTPDTIGRTKSKIFERDIWSPTMKDIPEKLIFPSTNPKAKSVLRSYGILKDQGGINEWIKDAIGRKDPADYVRTYGLMNDYAFDRNYKQVAKRLGIKITDEGEGSGEIADQVAELLFEERPKTPKNMSDWLKLEYGMNLKGIGSMFKGAQVAASEVPLSSMGDYLDRLSKKGLDKDAAFKAQWQAREKVRDLLKMRQEEYRPLEVWPTDELAGELAGSKTLEGFKRVLRDWNMDPIYAGKKELPKQMYPFASTPWTDEKLTKAWNILKKAYVEIPSEYFEAKTLEPVSINEFPEVHIPKDRPELAEKLKQAGFTGKIKTYNKTFRPRVIGEETDKGAPFKYSAKQTLAPTFYSQMAVSLDKKLPGKAPAEVMVKLIEGWAKKPDPAFPIKAKELKWSGLIPWLQDQTGPVTKQQVVDKVREGMVEVRVVEKGREIPQLEWDDADTGYLFAEAGVQTYIIEWMQNNNKYKLSMSSGTNRSFDSLDDAKKYAEKINQRQLGWGKTKFQSYLTDLPESFTNRREILLTVPKVFPQPTREGIEKRETIFRKYQKEINRLTEAINTIGITPAERRILEADREALENKTYMEADKEYQLPADIAAKKEDFNVPSSHAYGDPAADVNRFAHVFTADYTDPATGKKYLVGTELQSDAERIRRDAIQKILEGEGLKKGTPEYQKKYRELFDDNETYGGVPPMPLLKNWHEVALKQLIRHAASEGYDGVMVVNGEMVKQRYDLSKQVDTIEYYKNNNGTFDVFATKDGHHITNKLNLKESELEGFIGKDVAQRIIDGKGKIKEDKGYILEGEDLHVGGTWTTNLYDRAIPSFLKKYVKQWGVEVGRNDVEVKGLSTSGTYIGPIPSRIDLQRIDSLGNDYPREIRKQAGKVLKAQDEGMGFKDAMNRYGSATLAQEFGGDMTFERETESLTTLPITPQMRESVLYRGQPLYKEKTGETQKAVEQAAAGLVTGAGRGTGNAEVRAAEGRLLEDVKSRGRQHALANGEPADFWDRVGYDGDVSTSPEFTKIKIMGAKHGVAIVATRNLPVDGVWFPGQTPVILIDSVKGLNSYEALAGHEVFHHRKAQGDPTALALVEAVDHNSPVFQAYKDVIARDYGAVGLRLPTDQTIAGEIAADFASNYYRYDLNNRPIPLVQAFKNATRAREMKFKYGRATPVQKPTGGVIRLAAKRGPPEQGGYDPKKYKVGKTVAPEVAGHEEGIENFMGGLPPGPSTIEAVKKITGNLKKNPYYKDLPEMSLLAEYFELPFWRALENPQFRKVYEVQANRGNLRNWANDELLGDLEPAMRWWKKLPEGGRQQFRDAVWHFDKLRVEPDNEALQGFGLDGTVIEHYRKLREVTDYIWDQDLTHLLTQLGMPKNDIDKLRRERGKINGFFPHLREGRRFIHARSKGGEWETRKTKGGKPVIYKSEATAQNAMDFLNKTKAPDRARITKTDAGWTLEFKKKSKTLYFELFDDIIATLGAGKRSPKIAAKGRRLEAEYPGARVRAGTTRRMPEEAFWHVDTQNMQAVIDAAVSSAQVPEGMDPAELRQALLTAVARTLQVRGFGQHFIPRQDVPGFDQSDPIKSVVRFVQGYNGFKTKVLAAREFSDALKDIDPKSRDWRFANKYIRDMLANSEVMDKVSDNLRSGFFVYFLGGVARQILLQPTQNFIAFVPAIQAHTKWSSAKIGLEMTRAARDAVSSTVAKIAGKKPTTPGRFGADEEIGVEVARKKGILAAQLTREYGAYLLTTMGKVGQGLTRAAQFFIGNAEIFNRDTAYRVAYRVARQDKKLDHEGGMRFAEQIVEMAHFRYGKANLPSVFRGGEAAKIFRSSYAFRSYNANLLRLYAHLGTGGTGKIGTAFTGKARGGQTAVLTGLLMLMAAGGLSSLYGYKWLEKKIQQWTGKNVRSEIDREMGGWAKLINYGLPAALGIDLSGSMGMEAPGSFKEIVGVPYALYDIPARAYEKTTKGDYYRALETIAPSAIKAPMAAYRLKTVGMTTASGKRILDAEGEPVKLGAWDAFVKAATFRTVTEADAQRRYEAQNIAKVPWAERRKDLVDELRNTVNYYGGDSQEVKDVEGKIEKFNQEWFDAEKSGTPTGVEKFTRKGLRQGLRGKEPKSQRRLREAFP